MNVQMKVGSVLRIPVTAGMRVTSSAPANVTATMAGTVMTVTAVKVGNAVIQFDSPPDLGVSVTVSVTS